MKYFNEPRKLFGFRIKKISMKHFSIIIYYVIKQCLFFLRLINKYKLNNYLST